MAKGKKPAAKATKGAKGHHVHGPKRHLHHSITPQTTRMALAKCGVLSKYDDFDSFSLAMLARGVRADMRMMWDEFCSIPMVQNEDGEWIANRPAQRAFFADAKETAVRLMKKAKGAK